MTQKEDESPPSWTFRNEHQLRFMATNQDGESRPYMSVTRSGVTADKLIIHNDAGSIIVSISLIDGTVDLQQPGKVPEAAEKFWRAIAANFPPAMSWQRIETAPNYGHIIGAWKNGKWHTREMWWDDMVDEWTDTMSDRYLKPTHWIRLPDE